MTPQAFLALFQSELQGGTFVDGDTFMPAKDTTAGKTLLNMFGGKCSGGSMALRSMVTGADVHGELQKMWVAVLPSIQALFLEQIDWASTRG